MSIKLSEIEVPKTGKVGQFIRPGVNELKIVDILLKESRNNDSYSPIFVCETKPIEAPNWTGLNGAAGQIGKISANQGYYIRNEDGLRKFLGFVKEVAAALNKTEEINKIEFDNLSDLIPKLKPLFCDGTYARYLVSAEEYLKTGGGKGLKLSFANRNSVESISAEPSSLPKYNPNDKFHYKALPNVALNTTPITAPKKSINTDDLPF